MKKAALALLVLAAAGAAWASSRHGAFKAVEEAAWMNTVSQKKGFVDYYFEIGQDGSVILRDESKDGLTIRRGRIKAMYAKDFFREIKSSDILNAQTGTGSKMVFYKGDQLQISAYINGELRRFEAPLNKFGEAFSYAMTEARKAAEKLPVDEKVAGFLSAQPLVGPMRDAFIVRVGQDYDFKLVETYDLQKNKHLMAAVKQPHRLIPLESARDIKTISDFITSHKIYGLRDLFYVKTTRGEFRFRIQYSLKEAEKPTQGEDGSGRRSPQSVPETLRPAKPAGKSAAGSGK
ncbi:MAG: hypothetical protein FD189_859 [Elusimicrobia bacterium]|nr:MAG: hypothetical protein FD154_938 [Elusimicrobiota bacterium]KAF0156719.1 MAG: hypothetical protein FD189_859 [Elusimicrobiota bacterium]